jgi:hypothetical protein
MQTRDESFPGRRQCLQQAVAMGGTGVLVEFAAGQGDAQHAQPDPAVSADDRTHQGYRLTEHIRTYYDTARS